MPETWQEAGFGLYVHWPFCQAKCPYCDFNSHVAATIDQTRWAKAYVSEIARLGDQLGDRVLRSVFFGGGTPSLMSPDTVAMVLEAVQNTWVLANDCEVTLEANPTSVEAGKFHGFRDAGVNRVSIGLQALRDDDLRRLGRLHSVAEGLQAVHVARSVFDRVSFDLIYARQDQSVEEWRRELQEALDLGPDHLSPYQLTIEDGTAFGARHAAGGLKGLPGDDVQADQYALTQDLCAAAGLPAYEVSNHAKPGAESRHNLIYWQSGDYAGIGPGAHGRLTQDGARWATTTPLAPGEWLRLVETVGSGETGRDRLDKRAQAEEHLMMGLRLTQGVAIHRLDELADKNILYNINGLIEDGVLVSEAGMLKVTPSYSAVLNAVLRQIFRD